MLPPGAATFGAHAQLPACACTGTDAALTSSGGQTTHAYKMFNIQTNLTALQPYILSLATRNVSRDVRKFFKRNQYLTIIVQR